jgi:hypothetical protein
VSDIDAAAADSLKALDLEWPIREADIGLLMLIAFDFSEGHLRSLLRYQCRHRLEDRGLIILWLVDAR